MRERIAVDRRHPGEDHDAQQEQDHSGAQQQGQGLPTGDSHTAVFHCVNPKHEIRNPDS
jgi:hypothetical protein